MALFTFQVLFMCFSLFRCFSCAFHFSGVLFMCFHFSGVFHFSGAFQVLFMKSMKSTNWGLGLSPSIIWKTKHMCAYMCHIYIHAPHVHHQIPPKYKIYPVGLPSVLYERPGQNERSVLNQLFLLLFRCFSWKARVLFTKSATFHEKHRCFSWKVQVLFMKSAAFHEKCKWGFRVITKYRSFDIRKTKHIFLNCQANNIASCLNFHKMIYGGLVLAFSWACWKIY